MVPQVHHEGLVELSVCQGNQLLRCLTCAQVRRLVYPSSQETNSGPSISSLDAVESEECWEIPTLWQQRSSPKKRALWSQTATPAKEQQKLDRQSQVLHLLFMCSCPFFFRSCMINMTLHDAPRQPSPVRNRLVPEGLMLVRQKGALPSLQSSHLKHHSLSRPLMLTFGSVYVCTGSNPSLVP